MGISYQEISGTYPDGSTYSLRKPTYTVLSPAFGEISGGVHISPRVANHMSGLGLLENVSETDLLARADENDLDQDGISGKANYVWSVVDKKTVHRSFWVESQSTEFTATISRRFFRRYGNNIMDISQITIALMDKVIVTKRIKTKILILKNLS